MGPDQNTHPIPDMERTTIFQAPTIIHRAKDEQADKDRREPTERRGKNNYGT